MACLLSTERGQEVTWPLEAAVATFGRSPSCSLVLEGEGISRHHGRFVRDDQGSWWVEDQGSKNGILVGGHYVTRRRLNDGDVITVGNQTLTFRDEGAPRLQTSAVTLIGESAASNTTVERPAGGNSAMDRRRLVSLYQVSQRLMDHRGLEELVETAASIMLSEFDAGVVVFGLTTDPDREPDKLIVRASRQAEALRLSLSILRRCMESRSSILVMDTTSDESLNIAESIVSAGIRSAMCVPMLQEDEVTGFVYVDRRHAGPGGYNEGDLEFAGAIGALLGAAVENIRLQEAEVLRQRMEAELSAARRVQQSILPSVWPKVAGWDIHGHHSTCREVGGDCCDAVVTDDGRVWMWIADVCGKGAGAALLASSVHAASHALIDQGLPPRVLLGELNELLIRHEVESSFVSYLLLVLEPRTGEAIIASAGHPHPIYAGMDRPAQQVEVASGLLLGVHEKPQFKETRWSFPGSPGTLLMYTDGLSEAMDAGQRQFGEGRLMAAMSSPHFGSAGGLIEHLVSQVNDFRGGADEVDDVTLLACRRAAG